MVFNEIKDELLFYLDSYQLITLFNENKMVFNYSLKFLDVRD